MILLTYILMCSFSHVVYSWNNPEVPQWKLFFLSLGSPFLLSFTIYYSVLCPLLFGFKGIPVIYMTPEKEDS